MTKNLKPKHVETHQYGSSKIDVEQYDAEENLKIDDQPVQVHRDAETGAYVSPEAPYQAYGTLDELGKAIVDCREEEKG